MAERSLEEMKYLAKPALENPEIVAKVAVAALGSPVRANTVVLPSIEDGELTKAWRWLLILARDSESKYGVSFDEVLSSFFRIEQTQPREENKEMITQTMSKTERFEEQITFLQQSADEKLRTQAGNANIVGFDPDRIEEILSLPLRIGNKTKGGYGFDSIHEWELQFSVREFPELQVHLCIDTFNEAGFLVQIDLTNRYHDGGRERLISVYRSMIVASITYLPDHGIVKFHRNDHEDITIQRHPTSTADVYYYTLQFLTPKEGSRRQDRREIELALLPEE